MHVDFFLIFFYLLFFVWFVYFFWSFFFFGGGGCHSLKQEMLSKYIFPIFPIMLIFRVKYMYILQMKQSTVVLCARFCYFSELYMN